MSQRRHLSICCLFVRGLVSHRDSQELENTQISLESHTTGGQKRHSGSRGVSNFDLKLGIRPVGYCNERLRGRYRDKGGVTSKVEAPND